MCKNRTECIGSDNTWTVNVREFPHISAGEVASERPPDYHTPQSLTPKQPLHLPYGAEQLPAVEPRLDGRLPERHHVECIVVDCELGQSLVGADCVTYVLASVCSCGWFSSPDFIQRDVIGDMRAVPMAPERCPIAEAIAERELHRRRYPEIAARVRHGC